MAAISSEVLGEFVAECSEISERVASELSRLEKSGYDLDLVNQIYRDMHTMKGSAQLFGFQQIGTVAHGMESSLEPMRRSEQNVLPEFFDALYKALDLIVRLVEKVRQDQTDTGIESEVSQVVVHLIEAATSQFSGVFDLSKETVAFSEENNKPKPSSESSQPAEVPETKPVEAAPAEAKPAKPKEEPSEKPQVAVEKASPAPQPAAASQKPAKEGGSTSIQDTTVRVQVELLDRLMNLVGELVLVRNQVLQYAIKSEDVDFINFGQNLDVVTSDLQEEVMKTRMQPIGNVLSKFHRVARDIAREEKKQIEVELVGVETELDKTLIEAIKDPLTHIVRNACDHGIETPEVRKEAGKPEAGTIRIEALHEGGQVFVEISDDGKGLNLEKIKAKALERQILSAEELDKLNDREVFNLIFAPGFSTADKVSSLSGRGVGMDVVRTNLEKLGGTVDLGSVEGKGTKITLKIPLTLAIVPAMVVRYRTERFVVPQVKLVELVRIDADSDDDKKIEYIQDRPFYRLRGNLLPLIHLSQILDPDQKESMPIAAKVETAIESEEEALEKTEEEVQEENELVDRSTQIVVLNADGEFIGLIVDEILDTTDVVVKPISQFLKQLSVFSGATIMGDGSVALILDVIGIARMSRIESQRNRDEGNSEMGQIWGNETRTTDSQEYLIFDIGQPAKYTVPLCLVFRLEEFPSDAIEYSGDRCVVQYRNGVLPVLSMSQELGFENESKTKDVVPVIVCEKRGRFFGFRVDSILDIIRIDREVDDSVRDRSAVVGNIINQGDVLVVVDILKLMDRYLGDDGGKVGEGHSNPFEADRGKIPQFASGKNVLLAEDTSFFRKQIKNLLVKMGFSVEEAVNGQEAYEKISKNPSKFDIVVSDIEMPKLNGYELAQKIREDVVKEELPLVAITTRFTERDREKGKTSGFDLYLEKLNPDELVIELQNLMQSAGKSEEIDQ